MSENLRFGCIGCGGMGRLHVRNSQFVPGMTVAAYADLDESRARSFLEEFGGEYATADPQQVIADDSLDGVLIQTGPRFHPDLGIAAARAGKHIFVEKPLAESLDAADALVSAVRENGIKCLVGLCNRLSPMVKRAKQLCPHPHYSFCMCSGGVVAQACHNLDLAVHLFHESPLISMYASGGSFYGTDPSLHADSFAAVLKFEDGSTHNYLQHGRAFNTVLRKYHYQLFGDDACVYLAHRFKEIYYCTGPDRVAHSLAYQGPDFSEDAKPLEDVRGPFGYMGHYEELAALVKSISSDTEVPITVEQGREVLRVEQAILESVATGQVIDMRSWRCPSGNKIP